MFIIIHAFLNMLPYKSWCRPEDLNPQPTDYKSVALPVELDRHIIGRIKFYSSSSFIRRIPDVATMMHVQDDATSGLLVAYSADVLLVALPVELDRHIIGRI